MPGKSSKTSLTGGTLRTGRPLTTRGLPRSEVDSQALPMPKKPGRTSSPPVQRGKPGPHPGMRVATKSSSTKLPLNTGMELSVSQIVDSLTSLPVAETFNEDQSTREPNLTKDISYLIGSQGFDHEKTDYSKTGKGEDDSSLRWSSYKGKDDSNLMVMHGRSSSWNRRDKRGNPTHGGRGLHSLKRFLLGDKETTKVK